MNLSELGRTSLQKHPLEIEAPPKSSPYFDMQPVRSHDDESDSDEERGNNAESYYGNEVRSDETPSSSNDDETVSI